eukprot:Pgem_evm1s7195
MTKLIIWNNIIKPIITYSCEIWWCDAVQLKKLECLQLYVLKWILGCSNTTSSSYVRNELVIDLDRRYGFNRRTWKSFTDKCIKECKLIHYFNSLVSRDINMNKWNCERFYDRYEFQEKIDKNNTSGLNEERGRHRGSLVSRNCNCCNIDVSNNDYNNNDNDDDDDV